MKIPFKDIVVGNCFVDRSGETKKKVSEKKASAVDEATGKVKTRKVKPEAEVEQTLCELRHLGIGLRRHPEMVVEIGDGNPYKKTRRKP